MKNTATVWLDDSVLLAQLMELLMFVWTFMTNRNYVNMIFACVFDSFRHEHHYRLYLCKELVDTFRTAIPA